VARRTAEGKTAKEIMSRQGNRLLIYSIQRCGAWADMGQWVVSVLGHIVIMS